MHLCNAFYNCDTLDECIEEAYFSQVDLIRRGLPSTVIQEEFCWAVNLLIRSYYPLQYLSLERVGVSQQSRWYQLFDSKHRSKYVLRYLISMKTWKEDINYISYRSQEKLPPMNKKEQDLVNDLWTSTKQRLSKTPRIGYRSEDIAFPRNIDVLYDPGRAQSCIEYYKFGNITTENSRDAKDVLILLTMQTIHLYRMGAEPKRVVQMLKHFVAFAFNGVRCIRQERRNIKIPNTLRDIYARTYAYIFSTISKPLEKPIISHTSVANVFQEEMNSLISYKSWGHMEYAKVSHPTAYPIIINSVSAILCNENYKKLEKKTIDLSRSNVSSSHSLITSTPAVVRHSTTTNPCRTGYTYISRPEKTLDYKACCCPIGCRIWSRTFSSSSPFPAEACCARCNQMSCPTGIQARDIRMQQMTFVLLPFFGYHRNQFVALVLL